MRAARQDCHTPARAVLSGCMVVGSLVDISVVIPTYNGAKFVKETLQSILAQTYPAREIIVVDDGSTDNTRDVIAAFGDRITFLTQANAGVQAARNAAIGHATSDWIAFCDQDDLWQPDYLAAQARLMQAAPEVEFAFSNFSILRDGLLETRTKFDDAPAGYWDVLPHRVLPEGWVFSGSIAPATYRFHPIFPSAMMVSKALLKAIGSFDTAMRGLRNEDGEMVLRCLYRAVVGVLPGAHVIIRRHADNYSRDLTSRLLDEIVTMNFIKQHHAEAAPYHAIIDDEIRLKYIALVDIAFAARDHARTREMFFHVAWQDRSVKMWIKRAVAALPSPVALRLNTALQRFIGGKVADESTFAR